MNNSILRMQFSIGFDKYFPYCHTVRSRFIVWISCNIKNISHLVFSFSTSLSCVFSSYENHFKLSESYFPIDGPVCNGSFHYSLIQLSPHWLRGPRILPNSVPFLVNRYSARIGRSATT